MKLRINSISFSYNSSEVLQDINFAVKKGECLGIIGPNGSGKSTLLKCIDMVLRPKTGTAFLEEDDLSLLSRREIAKKVGLVFQRESTDHPFTVLNFVLLGRSPHLKRWGKESSIDLEVVENAMRITDTHGFAARSINELSGGELQRIIIARALAQQPEVLLLDEPTLHLDVNHQLELIELIMEITKKQSLVTIFVSHDLNLAARYCDKLVLLKSGKIYSAGLSNDVLTEKNLKEVFNVNVEINYNASLNFLNVILLSPSQKHSIPN